MDLMCQCGHHRDRHRDDTGPCTYNFEYQMQCVCAKFRSGANRPIIVDLGGRHHHLTMILDERMFDSAPYAPPPQIVLCGRCNGEGIVRNNNQLVIHEQCHGTGKQVRE